MALSKNLSVLAYCCCLLSSTVLSARDYSLSDCESNKGGLCRRNDNVCGDPTKTGFAEYTYGGLCNLPGTTPGTPPAGQTSFGGVHSCCLPSKYVPTNANGNEITGTSKEIADATRQYFLDLTYVVPNENCDDPSQESCALWMGSLNRATVEGLHDILVTSECDIPKVIIEKATELSHSTNNFGVRRTAQFGYVFTISGSMCVSSYIKANMQAIAAGTYSGSAYESPSGDIYVEVSSVDKRWELMFNVVL